VPAGVWHLPRSLSIWPHPVISHAHAILDAHEGNDQAGLRDAVIGLALSAQRYAKELDERGVADAG